MSAWGFFFPMNHIILFDSDIREELLPLTYTRPVSELRLGIFTIREKWNHLFRTASFSHITSAYLEPQYPIRIQEENILINGAVIPTPLLHGLITNLSLNEAIMLEGELIAARLPRHQFQYLLDGHDLDDLTGYEISKNDIRVIRHLWDIPDASREQIAGDMRWLPDTKSVEYVDADIRGTHAIYIHPEARLEKVIINAEEGPVYIGKSAHIMDGSILRGPIAIGEKSVIKMGAKLFGGTVAGPQCMLGGEIKNSTFLGYSNKAHEGYVGDSVIGEYCNLGALTTGSNLKNTYSTVKVWSKIRGRREDSKQIKCGFFMGDYTTTAIQTRIGAGTVIGVGTHIIGTDFCHHHVPSFSWGGVDKVADYQPDKVLETCERLQSHKGKIMETSERELLRALYRETTPIRATHPSYEPQGI